MLEVLLQVMITRMLGLAGYGTYSTWVSAADLVYWVLFSGITKCNTFYLSNKGTELRRFKAKYYSCYVLPVLTTLALVLALEKGRGGYTVIALITGMELLVMDHSSTMMAQGQPGCALFGEYVLGRLFLVLGTLVLYKTERLSLGTLLALYGIQYAGILVLFLIKRDREPRRDISKELSLRKWGSYQRADLIQALISQMPILLQYFFTGAFEAGIVSVVLMVKKLVNFISGPTAKVFLPEFSRMYHAGDKAGIKQCYASIMRIQMLFAGSMAVVLVGYPQVLLSILADHHFSFLIPHSNKAFIRDPWAAQPTDNPGLANLNPEPSFPLHFLYFLLPFHAQIVYNRDGSDLPSRVVRRGKGDRDEILLPRHLFIRSEKGNVLRDVSRPHRL